MELIFSIIIRVLPKYTISDVQKRRTTIYINPYIIICYIVILIIIFIAYTKLNFYGYTF